MLNLFRKPKYAVNGPLGGIATTITIPNGFDPINEKCPMAILMHGFMAQKRWKPISSIAKSLAESGIASISFDFEAHGQSEGKFIEMTLSNEISDARAILEYTRSLPYVSRIYFVGHSQGGVVAGMLAGQLAELGCPPDAMVLLAPAAVLKDDAIKGQCMNARYDASNPPEYVNVMFHKLGRKFILEAQNMPIYETSAKYSGPVCIIHGSNDKIVPLSYSDHYHRIYTNSEYHIIEKESHMLTGPEITRITISFLKGL